MWWCLCGFKFWGDFVFGFWCFGLGVYFFVVSVLVVGFVLDFLLEVNCLSVLDVFFCLVFFFN